MIEEKTLEIFESFFDENFDETVEFLIENDVIEDGEDDEMSTSDLVHEALQVISKMSPEEISQSADSLGIDLKTDTLSLDEIGKKIDFPVNEWPLNCYYVSTLLVKHGIFSGKAVFGKYLGEISQKSPFSDSPIPNHGWIVTDDNKIVDPTRWVFEHVKPYLYIGEVKDKNYDRGANSLRTTLRPNTPSFDATQNTLEIDDNDIHEMMLKLLEGNVVNRKITVTQACFVASLSLDELDDDALPLFKWLTKNNKEMFIPVDNYEWVMEYA